MCDDLDDVAVAQVVFERHHSPVHLRARATMPHIRMDGVSKIHRRSFPRQDDDSAFGCEAVNLFRVQVHLQAGHELRRIARFLLPFDELAQPLHALVILARPLLAFFVLPMSGDTVFGDAVHRLRPDLHLKSNPARAHYRSVQRLVKVRSGDGYKILDATRNRVPLVVNLAQRRVAIADRVRDDPDPKQIVDFIYRDFLLVQFLVHRPGTFAPPFDARRNALRPQLRLHGGSDFLKHLLVCLAFGLDCGFDVFERCGIQVTEPQVLQFRAQFAHAQTMSYRRVQLDRLRRNPLLFVARHAPERAHVVQPVGQFDDDNPDVLHHGEEHLAHTLRLAVLAAGQIDFAEFGDAVDAARDIFAEEPPHLLESGVGILDNVVQQGRGQTDQIHLHAREDRRHLKRMEHVKLAGHPPLPRVSARAKFKGFAEYSEVLFRPAGMDELLEFHEAPLQRRAHPGRQDQRNNLADRKFVHRKRKRRG